MSAPRRRPDVFWVKLIALLALATALMLALGAPAPYLLAGGVSALWVPGSRPLPRPANALALGIVGVEAGSMMDARTLRVLAETPVVTVGGAVATVVITLAFGQLLRLPPRRRPPDRELRLDRPVVRRD